MSAGHANAEKRRAKRKPANFNATVRNMITGQPMGHLGNLSSAGMLLISAQAPVSAALYQVSIDLPPTGRSLLQSQPIEVGIQEQWHEPAASPGQVWSGYRIIAISDADAARLESWLTQG